MTLYEKAKKNIEKVKAQHAAKIKNLLKEIEKLTAEEEEANAQRMEALQSGNQKLYQAACFTIDSARTQRKAKTDELNALETEPMIDKNTADILEADMLAGMVDLAGSIDEKFIKILDELMPEYLNAAADIKNGNELLKTINADMLKDPKSVHFYEVTGKKGANAKQYNRGIAAGYFIEMIRRDGFYKDNGGKFSPDSVPIL